jgi:MarR family transcriptional regulator, organic hydroperoxide resistance regulator
VPIRAVRRPAAGPPATGAGLLRIDAATTLILDPPLQFMRLLWELVHALQTTSKRMRRDLGITGPQRLVVRVIGLCPGVAPGALARILHVDPSTMTGILQRLERQRLVRRSADRGDGRRVALQLTAAGTRIDSALSGTVEAAVRETLAGAAGTDTDAARRLLEALVERMAPAGAPAALRRSRARR